ncbi:hypothetical protein [Longimicrobium sp.]|uniref:hypothetical protein n=1 Tax=Longimicrobium sp. TaxID=2029185 RepID=UPI002E2FAD43|nr:hypothetical protein [Longimicrobium sp.]HEX6039317.1 hypothetical protein [Longimicrobium sp.]
MNNQLLGTVQSGGTDHVLPLAGATVTLYAASPDAPAVIGTAVTDGRGRFSIDRPESASGAIHYATAGVGGSVLLAAVIGPKVTGEIVINELTTVAAVYSMAQLTHDGAIQGSPLPLRVAAGMSANLADVRTGEPSIVLRTSPNADETIGLRSLRALGNLLAGCVRRVPGATYNLLALTTPPGGTPAADTFQALGRLARDPAHNVAGLYGLARAAEVFTPALTTPPDAWTLAVKVNDTGSDDHLFGGPANVAFDANGYAWIANNVVQGTPNSGNFIVVLRPDGTPADGTDGEPRSPVTGGGLIGPGWGITIAPDGHVWVGNFGWGDPTEYYPVDGTVSEFLPDGTPVSPDAGYGGGTNRVQAIEADAAGNVWTANFAGGNVVVFPGGDSTQAIQGPAGTNPFGVAFASDGTAWVSNSGGLGWPTVDEGSVTHHQISADGTSVDLLQSIPLGSACKVIQVDSLGNVWLASGGDSTVYLITPDGELAGAFTGVGGMDAPWGLAIDGHDHVWVANFGRMGLGSNYTRAALTRLAGANPATRPEGMLTGHPLTPHTGYTLPSGGDPVLLRTGTPLYGPDGQPCYSPLMRQTSCVIDAAGNVWVVNNWKPDFTTDFPTYTGNPGGDGLVIFVGLAPPRVHPTAATNP